MPYDDSTNQESNSIYSGNSISTTASTYNRECYLDGVVFPHKNSVYGEEVKNKLKEKTYKEIIKLLIDENIHKVTLDAIKEYLDKELAAQFEIVGELKTNTRLLQEDHRICKEDLAHIKKEFKEMMLIMKSYADDIFRYQMIDIPDG